MEERGVQPQDRERLYELLMIGASTVVPVEAAERLVFQAVSLRDWLIEYKFMRFHGGAIGPYVATHFDEAIERIRDLSKDGRLFSEFGPGKSERAVLYVAASLSGGVNIQTLRYFVSDLNADHARLTAEALMYAAGYMDGIADPVGNEPEGRGTGPNSLSYDKRIMG